MRSFRPAWGVKAEVVLAAKHVVVSVVGFAIDFVVLHLGIRYGLEPAWARVLSLGIAVNVTFGINRIFVFREFGPDRRIGRQWISYLISGAFGNLCNYWLFVTLVSLHHPRVSSPAVAICISAAAAWIANYSGARLFVFGSRLRGRFAGRALVAGRSKPARRSF